MTRNTILLIGTFFSHKTGTKSVSEDIADNLLNFPHWDILTTSSHPSPLKRLIDIMMTVILQRRNYSVANIEVYSGRAFLWAEIAAKLLCWLEKPFVLSLHGGKLPLWALNFPERMQRLLSNANAVLTPSYYIQHEFRSLRDDIIYIPNGIKLENYQFKQRSILEPNLCWLRAFHHIYNPQLAIETLSILYSSNPKCNLIMLGPDKHDGTYKKSIELAKNRNILDSIQLIGPIMKSSVPYWLNKCDIFLNTTQYESFGIGVIEAAACGLAIVSTNVGEIPYLWENEVDALLVKPDDPQAMANAIQRLLLEPNLATVLSSNARKKVERFDWSMVLPQWNELFELVLSQRNKH